MGKKSLPASGLDPLVQEFARIRGGHSYTWLEERSGVGDSTISNWLKLGRSPTLCNFRAVLNVLGYDLAIVPLRPRGSCPSCRAREESSNAAEEYPPQPYGDCVRG